MSAERWLPIDGFDGRYEVSDYGRVRGMPWSWGYMRNGKWREIQNAGGILDGHIAKYDKGLTQYRVVGLSKNGKAKLFLVHRLVLLTFVGPPPFGMEGCHFDGNGLNNRLQNLRWDTHKNNHLDSVRHGHHVPPTPGFGENHPNAKLSSAQVQDIRVRSGQTLLEMASEFGVSFQLVSQIRRGIGRKYG